MATQPRNKVRRNPAPKRAVAFRDGTIAEEHLPLPIVHYPGFYGPFFGFAESQNAPVILCSCSRDAVELQINTRLRGRPRNAYAHKEFLISSSDFPMALVMRLMSANRKQDKTILTALEYRDRLCHACNVIVPTFMYCHPMYGGVFKRNFGWYVAQETIRFGISRNGHRDTGNAIHEEIRELRAELREVERQQLETGDRDLFNDIRKIKNQISNTIENVVRLRLGYKKVGEGWASETLLYHLVANSLPGRKVTMHARPSWLEGLEIDVYVEEMKLAIEYQGAQHERPMEHWGGEESFARGVERDKRKAKLCKSNGVTLVHFWHDEELSPELVVQRLGLS